MAANAIEIQRVSKQYLLGEHHGAHGTVRDALSASFRQLVGRERSELQAIWSLRDVTLEVGEGQAVGLIGRNGSGKSTLLKIVARITEPTSGVSRTRGRVGALLEVGTGFHPELTGRDNVYLNGAILGMRRREIARRFDEIVDFAGVHRFLDTPVKRYSSGMYLRLAFAVAAHLDCEIMVVDEILAVGDAEFQRKCLGKMGSMEREGRTVVFVSHDLDAITRLCSTAAWLERGALEAYGPSRDVIDAYLAAGVVPAERAMLPDEPDAPGWIREAALLDANGNPAATFDRYEPLVVEVRFAVRERVPGLDLTVFVENLRGVRVLDEAWSENAAEGRGAPGEYVARIVVPPLLLPGDYVVGFWMGTEFGATFVYREEVLRFRLRGEERRPNRIAHLGLTWDVSAVEDRAAARG